MGWLPSKWLTRRCEASNPTLLYPEPWSRAYSSRAAAAVEDTVPAGDAGTGQVPLRQGHDSARSQKWLTARTSKLKRVVENYYGQSVSADSKLGVGDTYLGEGSGEALVLAINGFGNSSPFYPTNKRADCAVQMALAHFRQMRAPQRDQTETRDTIKNWRHLSSGIRTATCSRRSRPSSERQRIA